MTKRIIAIALVVVAIASMFSFASSAATCYFTGNSFSSCCTATLSKPGKNDASVKVSVVSTGHATVRMTDANGRYIWGESNAIKVGGILPQGSRTFKLGRDHSVYKIYVKTPYSGQASFSNAKNCSIK